jgi:hypothetical protein
MDEWLEVPRVTKPQLHPSSGNRADSPDINLLKDTAFYSSANVKAPFAPEKSASNGNTPDSNTKMTTTGYDTLKVDHVKHIIKTLNRHTRTVFGMSFQVFHNIHVLIYSALRFLTPVCQHSHRLFCAHLLLQNVRMRSAMHAWLLRILRDACAAKVARRVARAHGSRNTGCDGDSVTARLHATYQHDVSAS